MVGCMGPECMTHFNPKDLGLSAGIFGTVMDSLDWIYGLPLGGLELSCCVCFGQFRDELLDC